MLRCKLNINIINQKQICFIPRCYYRCNTKTNRPIKTNCDADFLRTNMLADYLDKMSTDVNYITYIEEEDDHQSYIQLLVVIAIIIFMFYAPKDR